MGGDEDACRELAAYLTGTEAKELADRLGDGDTLSVALAAVAPSRRQDVRALLTRAGLGPSDIHLSLLVLRAIEGAHPRATSIGPVWTMPGNLAQAGQLTASVEHLVAGARESVMCSTFNFQKSSSLWAALTDVAARPEVTVRIYLDTNAADGHADARHPKAPTTEIAAKLRGARVMRTRRYDGAMVRNHAKFIAVDHQYLLVTSANFSQSAERYNVEFGLLIHNPNLTQAVEKQMLDVEPLVYEHVFPT